MKEGSWFHCGFNVKLDQPLLQSQEMAIYINETMGRNLNFSQR
jgi:hypothetical protein